MVASITLMLALLALYAGSSTKYVTPNPASPFGWSIPSIFKSSGGLNDPLYFLEIGSKVGVEIYFKQPNELVESNN